MKDITGDYRKKLAADFISVLEENSLNWKKEWGGQSSAPMNGSNNKEYKGINNFYLRLIALQNGLSDPRWCTFKQIQANNWHLQKGSKGAKVEYWLPYDIKNRKSLTWAEFEKISHSIDATKNIKFLAKYYTVFNAGNIVGIPPLPIKLSRDIHVDEIILTLSKNMNVEIVNDVLSDAYYSVEQDKIHLPKPEYFYSDYAYNSTVMHELAHATGAPARLNRNMGNVFNTVEYAYEELVAEISACFMGDSFEIEQCEEHIENHKAYVQNWIQMIKDKPDVLIRAIKDAEKVSNYMDFKAQRISENEYLATDNGSVEVQVSKVIQEDIATQISVEPKFRSFEEGWSMDR